jgi:non-ribosomal peptide synthetase component F
MTIGILGLPSTAIFMRRFGERKPGLYPHLRLSLFCGEALPVDVVRDRSLAPPNSVIENIYGPTEFTIGCTAYRWNNQTSLAECEQGYRTEGRVGDSTPDKPLIYLGRVDSQVLGHRVELGEVEAVVRSLCGVDAVVALAWPNSSNVDGIELFLEAEKFDTELLMKQLKTKTTLLYGAAKNSDYA